MVFGAGYGLLGVWFALKTLIVGDEPLTREESKEDAGNTLNLINILLICGITSLTGGTIRFLTSYYMYRSVEKDSKTPAKVWCAITFFLVIAVTAVILAASQKDASLFQSTTVDIFLCFAGIDFLLLLYFLWVIIVYVKEAIDLPPVLQ